MYTIFDVSKKFETLLKECDSNALNLLEFQTTTLINKERERRANAVTKIRFQFYIHRDTIRMEDLMGENVFPCDFCLTIFYASIKENTSVKLWPIILPSDKSVLTRLMNRKLSEEQKDENKDGIEAIRMWYIDRTFKFYDEKSKETMDSVCEVLRTCLGDWMCPVDVYSPNCDINLKDFHSLWVGIEDGRLAFHLNERPRCIKIWDDVKMVKDKD